MDPNMTKHSGRDRQRSNGSAPRLLMAMSAFLAVACVVTADKGAHGHVARATSVIVQDAAPGSAGRCRQSPHTCVADPLNFTARTPLRTAWLSIIAVNDNNVVFRGLASVVQHHCRAARPCVIPSQKRSANFKVVYTQSSAAATCRAHPRIRGLCRPCPTPPAELARVDGQERISLAYTVLFDGGNN
jgi:hypothetical protein